MTRFKPLFITILLASVMMTGIYVRVDDYKFWQKDRENFFFQSESLPVLLNPDSYYYLDIADEFLKGTVRKNDLRRQAPTGFLKPLEVPLLSFLIALTSKISGKPVEWIGVFLPIFLSSLLALPVYFLTYHLTIGHSFPWSKEQITALPATSAGLLASLLALLSPTFAFRSALGRCDTDMLHLCFSSCAAMLGIMLLREETSQRRPYLLQAIWLLNMLLFLWWWDFAFWPAIFLAGTPWITALILYALQSAENRTTAKNLITLSLCGILLCALLFNNAGGILEAIRNYYNYIFEIPQQSLFPGAAQNVTEQNNIDLQSLAVGAAGAFPQFIAALFGLGFLGIIARKKILVLGPLIFIASLSLSAERFIIFTAPLLGLGGAALALAGWSFMPNRKINPLIFLAFAAFMIWSPYTIAQKSPYTLPRTKPVLFEAMKEFAPTIADDGVIWASWGHGHPLIHYTKKKTIGDGIHHSELLQYIQNFPVASSDFRLAANWICFYARHGEQGLRRANRILAGNENLADGLPKLQKIFAAGPETGRLILQNTQKFTPEKIKELLTFFFPADAPPVYLLLDYMYLGERWFAFGRFDLAGNGSFIKYNELFINPFKIKNDQLMTGVSKQGIVRFNLQTGHGTVAKTPIRLTKFVYEMGSSRNTIKYSDTRQGFVLYAMKNNNGFFSLLTDLPAESVFNKLFFEKNFSQKYFQPIRDQSPLYLFCRVKGEHYPPSE